MQRPAKPTPDFPLSPNLNGQWFKKIKGGDGVSKPYYFGSWKSDPKGEAAIREYDQRQAGILAGTDHLRHLAAGPGQTVGDLLRAYSEQRKVDVASGSLSKLTFGDYISELALFVEWVKPTTAVAALKPEHFTAFATSLVQRGLKAHARKRIQATVKTMFRWGPNAGFAVPEFGSGFKSPSTTAESLRKEKARAGIRDHSERIVTGAEIDKLLANSQPNMRAMILLAVNCGLGPADIGRLQWFRLQLNADFTIGPKLDYPRGKTGNKRVGYLWKRTREALTALLKPKSGHPLKHTMAAWKKDGTAAPVFVTRKGLPYWRAEEVVVEGKVVDVREHNAISITFGRLAKALEMEGVSFYRLRHTFATLARRANDEAAMNLAMGHKKPGVSEGYNHEHVEFKRVKRVAVVVKKRLWPKPKRKADTIAQTPMRIVGDDAHGEAA